MKVTLIQPHFGDRLVHFPLGLGYLAAVLEKNDIDVRVIDLNFEDEKELKKVSSSDIVGISCMTKTYQSVIKTAKKIKEMDSEIPILLGGPHPSVMTDACLSQPEIDICVIGEGEHTLLELVKNLKNNGDLKNIQGIAYKENGEIKRTQPRPLIRNLDELPYPAYHLFDIDKYIYNVIGVNNVRRLPWISMMTSRGCPHSCTFCSKYFGRLYRSRSPDNVLEEIKFLVDEFGIKEILIVDNSFTTLKKRAIEICDKIAKSKLDIEIRITAGVRADDIDREIIASFKKAGVYNIAFGLESGTNRMLKLMKKGMSIKDIENAINLSHEFKINTIGFFIIGLPGETMNSALKTIELAKKIPLDDVAFYPATPFPGTEFFDWAVKKGFINESDWSTFDLFNYRSVCRTDDLTPEQIVQLVKKGYKEFYFRPFKLIQKLSRLKNFRELKIAFFESLNWFKSESRYYSKEEVE